MIRRRPWLAATITVLIVILALVVRNQIKVYRDRQARANQVSLRQSLFDALQPVALANCRLERFGEAHDGGYLLCGNLLDGVAAGYSYGIGGYDKWGCDISTRFDVTLHQYDCFNTKRPACPGGDTIFHAECVGVSRTVDRDRVFDTIENQLVKNGDRAKRLVMKMDVEGAEWEALLSAPDEVLQQIDQLAIELHWLRDSERRWTHDPRYLALVERLQRHFHVAHLHFNNYSCLEELKPFPAWAFEVLFVNKRLGVVDASRPAGGVHMLDAPNDADGRDCQR